MFNDRRGRREFLAMLTAISVTRESLAQDAVAADPRSFRILLENDRVRVLEYRSRPGLGVCGQGMHYHPDRVSITLTDAKVRVTNSDGLTVVREIGAGHVFYSRAETHAVENIGGAGTRLYIVELKGDGYRPSTGIP